MQGNDLRKGTVLKLEGKIWQCIDSQHRTPGNLRAFVQAKMRNLTDGSQKEFRFSATEKLESVDVFERNMQFLYQDGTMYHFMDTESYDQIELSADQIGSDANYLSENLIVFISFVEEKPMNIRLPQTLEFEITEADPEIKGATATASYKSATISNGMNIQVPQFVKVGDWVKINTETGSYQERVKK